MGDLGVPLQGELCELVLLGPGDAGQAPDPASNTEWQSVLGRPEPFSREKMANDIRNKQLVLWRVKPTQQGLGGFVGVVWYSGPPYVFIYFDDDGFDFDIATDALMVLVPHFFETTTAEDLLLYVSKPVDPEVDDALVEAGFVADEDMSFEDSPDDVVYVYERHTYDAYFKDSDGS